METENLSKLYYLGVGPEGTFQPQGDYNSTPADVKAIFQHLAESNKKNLVLYFHGGLVGEGGGMKTAKRFTQLALSKPNLYPISFIWKTSILNVIEDKLNEIRYRPEFQEAREKATIAIRKNIDKNKQHGNLKSIHTNYRVEFEIELAKEIPYEGYTVDEEVLNSIEKQMAEGIYEENLYADVVEELQNDPVFFINPEKDSFKIWDDTNEADNKGLAVRIFTIALRIIKRFVARTNHEFFPTIIEEVLRTLYIDEIGCDTWSHMKDKAVETWKPDVGTPPDNKKHVGSCFLDALQAYATEDNPVTLNLVGHSAGSIMICHLVNEIKRRDIENVTIKYVIFMAPACRTDLFYNSIIKNKQLIGNIRIYTMSDAYETKDKLAFGLYPASLLYLISGILEKDENDAHILGMQRYLLNNRPYRNNLILNAIINYFGEKENRIVYALTTANAAIGLRSSAQSHGHFDNNDVKDPDTLNSVVHVLSQP